MCALLLDELIRRVGQRCSDHDIDLALPQAQLDVLGRLFIVRADGLRNLAQARVDVPQVLRVRHEEIDVLALPVVQSEHQDCSAAERPDRPGGLGAEMIHQPQRLLEQFRPDAGSGQVGRLAQFHRSRRLPNSRARDRMLAHSVGRSTLCRWCTSSTTSAMSCTEASSRKAFR